MCTYEFMSVQHARRTFIMNSLQREAALRVMINYSLYLQREAALRSRGILVRPKKDGNGVVGLRMSIGTLAQV